MPEHTQQFSEDYPYPSQSTHKRLAEKNILIYLSNTQWVFECPNKLIAGNEQKLEWSIFTLLFFSDNFFEPVDLTRQKLPEYPTSAVYLSFIVILFPRTFHNLISDCQRLKLSEYYPVAMIAINSHLIEASDKRKIPRILLELKVESIKIVLSHRKCQHLFKSKSVIDSV